MSYTTEELVAILRRAEPTVAVRHHLSALRSAPDAVEIAAAVEFLRGERLLRA